MSKIDFSKVSSSHSKLPDRVNNDQGEARKVGVEIEMSGIELSMIVTQCNIVFGGQIREISPYEFIIDHSEIGKIKVELDFRYLKKLEQEKFSGQLDHLQFSEIEHFASDALAALSKNIIPCEVIAPPLPIYRLDKLKPLIDALRKHGAKGTRHSVLYANGVHLNPELPNLKTKTVLNYLRAFLCLQDWLIETEKVSITRKLSPFIDKFSGDYVRLVLNLDYQPEQDQLIDDYLRFNPSRNRALDMLPLFAYLDTERVKKTTGNQKLNIRPTLHYRLPNSDIDNPQWGIHQCWNHWLQVESLAHDTDRLSQVCEAYRLNHELFSKEILIPWKDKVQEWLVVL